MLSHYFFILYRAFCIQTHGSSSTLHSYVLLKRNKDEAAAVITVNRGLLFPNRKAYLNFYTVPVIIWVDSLY